MDHIWYWFAYSFLGYCLEKLFAAATRSSHRLRRCFVFLPLCPVYGFAMVTILLLGAEKLPGAWEQILLGTLAATAMEYAVHWGYERLFQVQFWDYSSTKCDVNGRICLPFSICWGAFKDYLGTISVNLQKEHLRISPKMTNIVPEFHKPQ